MAVFKCKMCGGSLEISGANESVGTCEYCGTKQTLPKLDNDQRINLYDRANHLRRNNEYDKAANIYEQILNEDKEDAEAYWSLVLCRYGIEYVEDPKTHKRVPTVNRAQYTSIYMDEDYKSAVKYADSYQKSIYEEEANTIDEIQKGILDISSKEEPFDVFICYKESDENGQRTQDSVLATDLYHQLTQEGFKVFFSRITLEDKLGTAYEPYIFAALNSAKVMVVLGTRPEFFKAVWVKNEWSRYLSLVKKSNGKKILIPAYRDMDPYDLPEEFSHLQAQDMSKLGFMQDLIRGIKKIVNADDLKQTAKETVVVGTNNANVTPLLERAFLFLEDGKWQDANIYCEKVLDIEPKNAEAYLGKLMVEQQVRNSKQLADCAEPFDSSENYAKVLRFGDEKLESEMRGYIASINERNENARLTNIYNKAVSQMKAATTEPTFKSIAETFKTISGFRDADDLAEQCLNKAEVSHKNAIYYSAKTKMATNTINGYEEAVKSFGKIVGWKDADEQIITCQNKIEELKSKEEAERLEQQRLEEQQRIAAEKQAKKHKLTITISISIVAIIIIIVILCVSFSIALKKLIIPSSKYSSAMKLYKAQKYEEAYDKFSSLDFRDSLEKADECKYYWALEMYDAKNYKEAFDIFNSLDILDSSEKAYDSALGLYNTKKYEEAYQAFYNLNYEDSSEKALESMFMKQEDGLKNITVGSTIKFGIYEQDNNKNNGKEEIEWIVLAVEEDQALVISKSALDCVRYSFELKDVSWEESSIRSWLNSAFYNDAFGPSHKKMISNAVVSADNNPEYNTSPGNDTMDNVFLLSISEADKYFSLDEERECSGTAYCYAEGAKKANNSNCFWWLRTPGKKSNYASCVGSAGSVDKLGYYVDYGNAAVRPAMWINIE